jgi:hypothetical protein
MSDPGMSFFGVTLKPELEDELIITVIATGFDSAYFHEQATELDNQSPASESNETIDNAVQAIDMDLDHTDAAEQFASDSSNDIWSQPVEQDDDDDTPAFLRRRKKLNHSDES